MKPVYLVCGVPGSGKSWVCEQLKDKFAYVRHDDWIGGDYAAEVAKAARHSGKPVLADCPFAERELRQKISQKGIVVYPVFIVESPQVVQRRYEAREKKPVAKNTLTRAMSIGSRADEWNAPKGTSEEILKMFRELKDA